MAMQVKTNNQSWECSIRSNAAAIWKRNGCIAKNKNEN
jgi:hypothetical protein